MHNVVLARAQQRSEFLNRDGLIDVFLVVGWIDDTRQPVEESCETVRNMKPFERPRAGDLGPRAGDRRCHDEQAKGTLSRVR
jgi:hypothetical protein